MTTERRLLGKIRTPADTFRVRWGSRIWNRAPPPGASSTVAEPPWASATARTRESPKPKPRWERLASPRNSRRQTASRSAAATPGPLSLTVAVTAPGSAAVAIVTRPPSGVNFKALSTRLDNAWPRRTGSPSNSAGDSSSLISIFFCSATLPVQQVGGALGQFAQIHPLAPEGEDSWPRPPRHRGALPTGARPSRSVSSTQSASAPRASPGSPPVLQRKFGRCRAMTGSGGCGGHAQDRPGFRGAPGRGPRSCPGACSTAAPAARARRFPSGPECGRRRRPPSGCAGRCRPPRAAAGSCARPEKRAGGQRKKQRGRADAGEVLPQWCEEDRAAVGDAGDLDQAPVGQGAGCHGRESRAASRGMRTE